MYEQRYIEGMCRNAILRYKCARNRKIRRMLKITVFTISVWFFVAIAILWFAVLMQDLAYVERGYYALGGELIVVLAYSVVLIYMGCESPVNLYKLYTEKKKPLLNQRWHALARDFRKKYIKSIA